MRGSLHRVLGLAKECVYSEKLGDESHSVLCIACHIIISRIICIRYVLILRDDVAPYLSVTEFHIKSIARVVG